MNNSVNVDLNSNHNLKKGKLISPSNIGDAGYDLVAASAPKIVGEVYHGKLFKKINYIEYDTNIRLAPETDEFNDYELFSYVFPRSSISKYNLSLCNSVGVIDSGFRDTIKLRFKYIAQAENFYIINDAENILIGIDESMIYSKGDKIGQLIFSKHIRPRVFLKDSLNESDRGLGGFGSTGS